MADSLAVIPSAQCCFTWPGWSGWWAEEALQQPWIGGPGAQQYGAGHAAGGIAQGQGNHQHVVQGTNDGQELRQQVDR
jgi:hypothetical protein